MTKKVNGIAMLALIGLVAFGTLAACGRSLVDTEANSLVGTWLVTVTFVDCTTGSVIRCIPDNEHLQPGRHNVRNSAFICDAKPRTRRMGEEKRATNTVRCSSSSVRTPMEPITGIRLVQRWHVLEDGAT